MLNLSDPYRAYAEGNVFSGNPLRMVVALYEGVLDALTEAKLCLHAGDVWGRSKAVNKAIKILTQLLVSLDHNKGGDISANLKRLYSYIQCRILEAHTQKSEYPLNEAERLLQTLLEGWKAGAETTDNAEQPALVAEHSNSSEEEIEPVSHYGFFSEETAELAGTVSAVF